MRPIVEVIQEIDTISIKGQDADTAVVILHGYGANNQDLFPLWQMWNHPGLNWFFPNGILGLPMGYYEGRSWFSIDVERLQRAMTDGTHRQMADELPSEFDATVAHLELYLSEIAKSYKKIVLGGFSQGAMLAAHVGLKKSLPVEGLVLLSGNLIAQQKLPTVARGIPFYQSHGVRDPILSVDGAKDLEKKLLGLGLKGKLETFSGGHEIPPQVISGVKSFLSGLL